MTDSQKFKIGDRVRTTEAYIKKNPGYTPYEGTVVDIEFRSIGDLIHVTRDDGAKGLGVNGAYRTQAVNLELIEAPTGGRGLDEGGADLSPSHKGHRMGLDKEEIDPEAYREFMRGL